MITMCKDTKKNWMPAFMQKKSGVFSNSTLFFDQNFNQKSSSKFETFEVHDLEIFACSSNKVFHGNL